jgi:hypothetical protein
MPESPFDPELSAQLHNTILRHAWTGSGRDLASLPSMTWWEISSPVSAEIATTLNPNLTCFLRLAKTTTWDPNFHFFYFLHSLQSSDYLHSLFMSDRFIYLYNPTSAYGDEEVGIMSVLFPDIAIIGVLTSLLDLTKKRNWQPTFLITMT